MQQGARLTGRGWALAVLGLAATVVAAYAGERDLIWITAVPLLLPVLTLGHLILSPPQLTHVRSATPSVLPIGEQTRVVVTVTSSSATQAAALSFTDAAPAPMGGGTRFEIARGYGAWRQAVGYTVTTSQRGRFDLGPLTATAKGPLGLSRTSITVAGPDTAVRVTPRVWQVDTASSTPMLGAADATPQQIGQAGSDDVLVREHRHGDDLRRVHWKMSAKSGDLMVRLEEHPLDPSTSLIVDTRSGAHFGTGPESSLEWVVSAVTSIATSLSEGRHRAVVVSPAGLVVNPGHTVGDAARQLVLEAMTDLTPSGETWLGEAVTDPQLLGGAASVVAATGRLTLRDAAAVAAAGAKARRRVALVPDVAAWGGDLAEHGDACALLLNHGWAVATYGPGAPVAAVWQQVAK